MVKVTQVFLQCKCRKLLYLAFVLPQLDYCSVVWGSCGTTVDREIFALKIIRVKFFRVDKFSRFRSIREILLTVDDCNMDERLESLWLLVYYQVSGKLGIARCSHRSDIYLGECGLARKLIHGSWPRNLFFACLIFAVGSTAKLF